ncbi:MAG: hypothetical protein RLZ76_1124, partial [Bacteroidota bacterium]
QLLEVLRIQNRTFSAVDSNFHVSKIGMMHEVSMKYRQYLDS